MKTKTLGIFVEQHLRQLFSISAGQSSGCIPGGALLFVSSKRWDTDFLTGLNTCVRFCPATIHPDLARAQQFLEFAETKPREMGLEPAIQAHAGFVTVYGSLFNTGHSLRFQKVARAIARPANSAAMDSTTLPAT